MMLPKPKKKKFWCRKMSEKNKSDIFQYRGAIHIHTLFSDGTGTVDSISKAAKKAGLKWIIITDHNSLEVEEGIFNGVYVLKGNEISLVENHYLTIDVKEVIEATENPRIYVNKTREIGGFGFAAHPDESLSRKNHVKPLRWLDKSIVPDGVEIWNWFSAWGDKYDESNIFTKAYTFLFNKRLVTLPHRETLAWWDSLNKNTEKIVPAIFGVDAHAIKVKGYILPLKAFPYKSSFKTLQNMICLREQLSDDFETAKKQIFNALKSGNNLMVNNYLSSDIPEISFSNSEGSVFGGEKINLDENTFLNIKFNKKLEIKIYRYDNEIVTAKSKDFTLKIEQEGKYRAEILYKNRGFVYTNPVIVTKN